MNLKLLKNKTKNLLPFIFFFFITFGFFYKFLTGEYVFAFKDLSRYFYPLRFLMVDMVKNGIMPLWNPYIFCGFPFIASLQIGFFYPVSLIYYILPFNLAFNYYIILHYFLAASFMYLLLRYLNLRILSSFLGGIIFAFSGYLLSVSNMNTSLTSVVWLPLVLLFLDKSLKEWGLLNFIFLSIFWALMFLGGEPTIIYSVSILGFFYLVYFYGFKIKNIVLYAFSFLFALCISAVQFLPFLELAVNSDRFYLAKYHIVSLRSLPVRELINFVFPFFFGISIKVAHYTEVLLGKTYQDWLLSPYIGFFPFFFAFLALIWGKRREKFWLFVFLFSIFLAFGKYFYLYPLLFKILPGISAIRYPVKFLFLSTFSIALLASFGFEYFLSKKISSKIMGFLFSLFIILALFSLILEANSASIFNYIQQKIYSENLSAFFLSNLREMINFNIRSLSNLSIFIFLGWLALYLHQKKLVSKTFLGIGFILIILVDLASVNISLNLPVHNDVYIKSTSNLKYLLRDESLYRYKVTNDLQQHNRLLYGDNYDSKALLEAKDKFAQNRLLVHFLYDVDGYESVLIGSFSKLINYFLGSFGRREGRKILDMLNTKYIASYNKINLSNLRLLNLNKDYFYGQVYLYENKTFLPRTYTVSKAKIISYPLETLEYMKSPNFDPRKEIIFAEKVPIIKEKTLSKAEIIDFSPNRIKINVHNKKPVYLFLSNSFYPGWKAYLNGKEIKIYRANHCFMGVVVERGGGIIEFIYKPKSFYYGSIISIVALALILSFFLFKTLSIKKFFK